MPAKARIQQGRAATWIPALRGNDTLIGLDAFEDSYLIVD
jgi:hypothetical protein